MAEAPTFVTDASTFTTILSSFCSINGFFAVTVTSLNDFATGINSIVFNVTSDLAAEISKISENSLL